MPNAQQKKGHKKRKKTKVKVPPALIRESMHTYGQIKTLDSKIQHKHKQCDEMLSTFIKITRANKLKNKL